MYGERLDFGTKWCLSIHTSFASAVATVSLSSVTPAIHFVPAVPVTLGGTGGEKWLLFWSPSHVLYAVNEASVHALIRGRKKKRKPHWKNLRRDLSSGGAPTALEQLMENLSQYRLHRQQVPANKIPRYISSFLSSSKMKADRLKS